MDKLMISEPFYQSLHHRLMPPPNGAGALMLWPIINHIFGREGLQTSNLVYGWSTKTRINVRDDLQAVIKLCAMFKPPLAGARQHYRPHSLLCPRLLGGGGH